MDLVMFTRHNAKRAGALTAALAFPFLLAASPAAAMTPAATVYADCFTFTTGSNNDGVGISCGNVVGGQARGRGDCVAAPDVYTDWVGAWTQSTSGSYCWFSERGTILEVR